MSSYNKVILIGRLTAQPEMRYTQTGTPVTTFTIAVDRNRKSDSGKERETDFISIVAWRRLAEICSQYLTKGKLIVVDGRLQTRSYTTQDGQKRKVYEVLADNMRMLSSSKGAEAPDSAYGEFDRETAPQIVENQEKDINHLGMQDLGMEDDVPF